MARFSLGFSHTLVISLCLVATISPRAGGLEDSYLGERNALIEKFTAIDKAGKADDHTFTEMTAALAGLEKSLEAVVGHDHIDGVVGGPKIHLDTLFKTDQGYGLLDGLDYAMADGKRFITVTTVVLLDHWLEEHKNWWGKGQDIPPARNAALRSEAFYTQAISTDAAVVTYGEIPVKVPPGVRAVALLGARTQADSPKLPVEILLSVVGKTRVFIIAAPLKTTVVPVAACTAIWDKAENQPQSRAGDDGGKLREQADHAYRGCFAANLKRTSSYAALQSEAQHLIDILPKQ